MNRKEPIAQLERERKLRKQIRDMSTEDKELLVKLFELLEGATDEAVEQLNALDRTGKSLRERLDAGIALLEELA